MDGNVFGKNGDALMAQIGHINMSGGSDYLCKFAGDLCLEKVTEGVVVDL